MLTNFENRIAQYMDRLSDISYPLAMQALDKRLWGMDTSSEDTLLDDLMILNAWLATVEWRTWEYNTFFANVFPVWDAQVGQYVDCREYVYPSEVIEPLEPIPFKPKKERVLCCPPKIEQCSPCACTCLCNKPTCNIVQSWIDHFLCCHYDITPLLRAWGVYPVGLRPDGISYMQIQTTSLCNPSIFMVEKQRI